MGNTLWVLKTTLPVSWREFEVTSFAQSLLEAGAGCVQHHKVSSTYKWEGRIQSEYEWSLQIKVSEDNKQAVADLIQKTHPYDVPQIIICKFQSNDAYYDWVTSG